MANADVKLLLVEDDDRICQRLVEAFTASDLVVDVRGSLREAQLALRDPYDLVLLDLGLPDGDGLELCRQLRSREAPTPVIVLTARGAPEERVRGLDAGADDYIAKPFHLPELMARIRAVLRRTALAGETGLVTCGALWADPETRRAGKGELELDLRRREFDLLLFLLRHRGRAWTRVQLLDRVWGTDYSGEDRTVDLHVGRLRAHIEDDPARPRYIQTVWGVGYRMTEEG